MSSAGNGISPASSPKCPVLYGPAPVGPGTPLVESLSGYLARLCEARSLAVTDVLDLLVRPLAPPELLRPRRDLLWYLSYHVVGMDGVGPQAGAFVRALEQLTGRIGFWRHTCLAWRALFAPRTPGVLAHTGKRWCSVCFERWHAEGVAPWEPLLWRLKPVVRCPLHRVRLSERCPSCGSRQRIVTQYVPLPHCDRCGRLLHHQDPLRESGRFDDSHDLDALWEWWTSVAVGQMLGFQTSSSRWGLASPSSFLYRLRRLSSDVGIEPFARHLGVGRTGLVAWIENRRLPRFSLFLRVCMLLGFHPAEVAFPRGARWLSVVWSPWPGRAHPWPGPFSNSFDTPRRRALEARWARVAATLDAIIAEGRCTSTRAVARSLGENYGTLQRKFPDRFAQLRSQCAAHRVAQRRADLERFRIALDAALRCLMPPSLNAVACSLGVTPGRLQRAHPRLCARLVESHAASAARRRRAHVGRRALRVRKVVCVLVAAGERPTVHGAVVRAGLPPTVSANPVVRDAWLGALRECGVSPETTRPIRHASRPAPGRSSRRRRASDGPRT